MPKYLAYDFRTGFITGKFDSEVTSNIPFPNVEVTEQQYLNYTNNIGTYSVINETLVENSTGNNSNVNISLSSTTHALYRNLTDTQTSVTTKTPLLIDGLAPNNFNTMGFNIYDAATSTIKPIGINQSFLVRINFFVTPTVAGTVFKLTFDVAGGVNIGGTVLINKEFEFNCLRTKQIIETYPLYVGQGFLNTGAIINVEADRPVAITKAGLYIIRLV